MTPCGRVGGLSAVLVAFALKKRRQVRIRELITDRILLTKPTNSTFSTPGPVLGEISGKTGRPEIRLADGRVVLMDDNNAVRLQIDGRLTPVLSMQKETWYATFPPSLHAFTGTVEIVYIRSQGGANQLC